jgi:methyl-accepting chemotaxis protein
METSVFDLLLNGSPMVAFAGFLIYLYKTQQARMDVLVDKFQNQLEVIRKEYKDDVQILRGRYDTVIETQNQERDRIKGNIEDRLRKVQNNLQSIHSTCQGIAVSQEVTKNELEQISRDVEAGLTAIKEMQEQARLKEIAKQALKDQGQ